MLKKQANVENRRYTIYLISLSKNTLSKKKNWKKNFSMKTKNTFNLEKNALISKLQLKVYTLKR